MDNHVICEHGYIKCDRNIYFICGICEFEATRQELLENHMETKHTKKTFWWQENDRNEYNCDMCEKKFNNLFVMRYHKCVQETKYACELCDFMGISLYELYMHLKETHTKEKLKCHMCKFESNTEETIDSHIQIEHKTTSVHISAKEQLVFTCDECGYQGCKNALNFLTPNISILNLPNAFLQ